MLDQIEALWPPEFVMHLHCGIVGLSLVRFAVPFIFIYTNYCLIIGKFTVFLSQLYLETFEE